jgi:hypothetical protein
MAEAYLAMDVAALEREIDAMVAAFPEMAEDEALRADMIEGELKIDAVLDRVINHFLEAETQFEAIKARASFLSARRSRYENRMKAFRLLAKRVLLASGRQSITLPEATVSISKAKERAIVSDELMLPQGYYKIEPKLGEILKSLKAGEVVPGATLELGEAGISVRKS